MNVVISRLGDVLHGIVEGFKAASSLFLTAFHISYFIGQCIVAACINLFEKIYVASQLLFAAFYVLYEDYCIFVVDLISKVKWLIGEFNFVINYVCLRIQQITVGCRNFCESIMYFFQYNFECVLTFFNKCGSFLYYCLEVLKQALVLMGCSIWYLLSIIPFGVVYIITLFLCYINETVIECCVFLKNVGLFLLRMLQNTVTFFSDIPSEAACGLILGFLLFCALVATHVNFFLLFKASCVSLKRIFQGIINLLVYLKEFISVFFSVLRNRNDAYSSDLVREGSPLRSCGSAACTARCCYHETELANKLCVVCQDKEKTVIVLPCRHVCLCLVCCTIIEENYGRCPVCRQQVERTMMVYI